MRVNGLNAIKIKLSGNKFVCIIGTIILVILTVALSSLLKTEFGAPNYGIGIVIGITLICHFFGFYSAILGFILAVYGVYIFSVEVGDPTAMPRLFTIGLTTAVTCSLVILLQNAHKNISIHNIELQKIRDQLAESLKYQQNIASTMQRAFLPEVSEHIGRISIAANYEAGSAEAEIGGDFYDFFRLSEKEFMVAIGDVSGKGIDAARQAIGAKYGLRSCIMEYMNPSEALKHLNNMLLLDSQFSGFTTVFAGILNVTDLSLQYSCGGHEPPILYRTNNDEYINLKTDGIIVGAFYGSEFGEDKMYLMKDDTVLLFTDGLSEARTATGMLGSDGIARIMFEESDNDSRRYLNRIINSARQYAGGRFRDDTAAVLLKIH